MAKKNFDTKSATSKFFTNASKDLSQETYADNTQNKHNTDNTHNKCDTDNKQIISDKQNTEYTPFEFPRRQGRPKKHPLERKRAFRYNLLLDADLNQFLHEIVWIKRTNMTQYVNDLIRADYEKYLKECSEKNINPFEG